MRFIIGVRKNDGFYWFKSTVEELITQMDDAAKFETMQEAQATLTISRHNPDVERDIIYLAVNA